jgi:hypothetical protein
MAPFGGWYGFESAHIFPLESESLWIEGNFSQWVTDMNEMTCISRINSCQNGLLLLGSIHSGFDNYIISMNPDVSDFYIRFVVKTNLGFKG